MRRGIVSAVATVLLSAGAGLVALPGAAQAASTSYRIAAARDSVPVGSDGETFLSADFYVQKPAGAEIRIAGSANGRSEFWVDDLLQMTVFHADGTISRYTADDSAGCTADRVLTTPPTSLSPYFMAGTNHVLVTFGDSCGGNDGNTDVYLVGTNLTVSQKLPTLPRLDGGTFLNFRYSAPGSGQACTTAFGTTDNRTGVRLMLSAKHCIDDDKGDQKTNDDIAAVQPMNINTVDDYWRVSTALNCSPPGSAWCVLPSSPQRVTGDMVAFKPDTAVPTGRVQTARGVLPVFGQKSYKKASGQVCHYGNGSLGHYFVAEQCGQLAGTNSGLPVLKAKTWYGDSGGPVYQYAYQQGRLGVYAIGMTVGDASCSGSGARAVCRDDVFVPIETVLDLLHQSLNVASA